MARITKEDRDVVAASLRNILRAGDTLHFILLSAPRKSRVFAVRLMTPDPNQGPRGVAVRDLSARIAHVTGFEYDKKWSAIRAHHPAATSTGFDVIYGLGNALYPRGFGCVGPHCPSNDHFNGDRDYTPYYDGTPRCSEEVGKDLKPINHWHADGGYAFRLAWL